MFQVSCNKMAKYVVLIKQYLHNPTLRITSSPFILKKNLEKFEHPYLKTYPNFENTYLNIFNRQTQF